VTGKDNCFELTALPSQPALLALGWPFNQHFYRLPDGLPIDLARDAFL
jgi:hypothetical protein